MAREASVPLTAFTQMNNNLMRIVEAFATERELEMKARREHEERLANLFGQFSDRCAELIIDALKPPSFPEPARGPLHVSEEEEELNYARAIGQVSKEEYQKMLDEVLFEHSPGVIGGTGMQIEID